MERTLKAWTKIRSKLAVALALCLLLAALPGASVSAAPAEPIAKQPEVDPLVRCEPTSVTALVGETAVIDLYVQDVTNLYGLDLRVSFDPTIGQVVDQDPAPGTQIQVLYSFLVPGFVLHRETQSPAASPPNCGVWCIWFAGTQLNPTPPATGSGPVARVTFLGLQAGTFPMNWINTQLSAPGGVEISPVNNQPCSVTFNDPLAVTLDSFDATAQADHILAAWNTVSEISNAGFNLYRSTSAAGPDQQLNAALIPSQAPGSGQGASYQWQDFDVESGDTYYYWLEAVALSGSTEMHGPVSATFAGPTAVTVSAMSASPVPASAALPVAVTLLALLLLLAGGLGMQRRKRA